MKILFVTTDLASGGAQRVVSLLANNLSDNNETEVVTIQGHKVKYKLSKDVKYYPILIRHKSKILRVFERTLKLREEIKKSSPDIVISFETENNIYSIVSCFFLNSKLIVSERNDPNKDPYSKLVRKIRDCVYPLADGFVFQTNDAKKYFRKSIRKRSAVIPNPINNDFVFDNKNIEQKKEIVNVCRLYPQKNIKLFIDILDKVIKKHPDYCGVVYGDGPEMHSLFSYAESKNISDKIIFKGFSSNIADDIQSAYMYLCTSDFEGISNSLIEAMTLGLPVVATDCPIGGTRMAIDSGYNGLLFPVGDVDGGVRSVNRLIDHPDEAARFGEHAIEIRNKWNINVISDKWMDYIGDILK